MGSDDAQQRRYNRYYARFEQPDPSDASYDLSDPQSFNRYSYVQNDPVNFIDPSGLNAESGGGGSNCWYMWSATGWFDGNKLVDVTNFSGRTVCYGSGGGGGGGAGGFDAGGQGGQQQTEQPQISPDCQAALNAANKDINALNRAYAAADILNRVGNANGIYPKLLAAIGVRETGFLDVSQSGGLGRGVFQIDVGQNPNGARILGNLEAEATFAAQLLVGYINYHSSAARGYPDGNYDADLELAAGVRDYNARHTVTLAVMGRPGATIADLDRGTARNNYVSNVLNLAKHCFNR